MFGSILDSSTLTLTSLDRTRVGDRASVTEVGRFAWVDHLGCVLEDLVLDETLLNGIDASAVWKPYVVINKALFRIKRRRKRKRYGLIKDIIMGILCPCNPVFDV